MVSKAHNWKGGMPKKSNVSLDQVVAKDSTLMKPVHYARKQMKVLVNNKSELSNSEKSEIKVGKLMWY
jgi:hypothetical protein